MERTPINSAPNAHLRKLPTAISTHLLIIRGGNKYTRREKFTSRARLFVKASALHRARCRVDTTRINSGCNAALRTILTAISTVVLKSNAKEFTFSLPLRSHVLMCKATGETRSPRATFPPAALPHAWCIAERSRINSGLRAALRKLPTVISTFVLKTADALFFAIKAMG